MCMNIENFLLKQLEHRAERMIKESESDPKDHITVDVPLFIRLLELAREDIKTDVELHQVVERTLAIKDRGTLTMADYDDIVGHTAEPTSEPTSAPAQDPDLHEIRRLAGL